MDSLEFVVFEIGERKVLEIQVELGVRCTGRINLSYVLYSRDAMLGVSTSGRHVLQNVAELGDAKHGVSTRSASFATTKIGIPKGFMKCTTRAVSTPGLDAIDLN